MPTALPLFAAIAAERSAARRAAHAAAIARWEECIPADLSDWRLDLDPAGDAFVLYRCNPRLATLPHRSFYAALADARRIAAYYELLPVAELERIYARRLAFRPPWHRRDGRLCRG
jgi:hypothetical protein